MKYKAIIFTIILALMLPTLMYGEDMDGKLAVLTNTRVGDPEYSVKLTIRYNGEPITHRYFGIDDAQYIALLRLNAENVLLTYYQDAMGRYCFVRCVQYNGPHHFHFR